MLTQMKKFKTHCDKGLRVFSYSFIVLGDSGSLQYFNHDVEIQSDIVTWTSVDVEADVLWENSIEEYFFWFFYS